MKKYRIYRVSYYDMYHNCSFNPGPDILLVADENEEKAKKRLEERIKHYKGEVDSIEETEFFSTSPGIIT